MASKRASGSTHASEGAVFVRKDGNIELRVRAKPGARRSQVMEVGAEEIGISIAAPPRDGEANEELIRHLRSVLNVSKSDLYFDKGAKSRSKILILASKELTVEQVVEKLKSDSSLLEMRSLVFGIFLGLFELIGAILSVSANCTKCDAYKCFEERLSCGPKGYFTAFGYPNCRRFNEDAAIARLSPTGKSWANCTMNCLLDAIDGIFVTTPATTCDQMKLLAFDSHVRCYVQCGFCDVCKTDKWALARTYNYCDFFSVSVLKQVAAIVKTCGLFSCFTG